MMAASRLLKRLSAAELGNAPWATPSSPPQATLPSHSDVAIVGAGLTGLTAAFALALKGVEVAVVDYAFGSGATSRSGGVVLGDTLVGPSPSFAGCEDALREWIADRRIDCDLAWEGCLELARDERLSPQPIAWHDRGSIRLETLVNGGVLDPAKLLDGLAAIVLRSGASIVDNTAVESIEAAGEDMTLVTSRGTLAARQVVMAVDATSASALDPWDERGITVAIQTGPIEPALLARVGLGREQAFYTKDRPLLWGRAMKDGSAHRRPGISRAAGRSRAAPRSHHDRRGAAPHPRSRAASPVG